VFRCEAKRGRRGRRDGGATLHTPQTVKCGVIYIMLAKQAHPGAARDGELHAAAYWGRFLVKYPITLINATSREW
jgi:hypothetical protein